MILADAGVWIDYLNGITGPQTAQLNSLLNESDELAIADLTLTEVLQGIRDQRRYEQTRFLLRVLPIIHTTDPEIAMTAAQNYPLLRARRITIRKTIDTLIATRCIADGHTLLFIDREFQPFVEHLGLTSAISS